MSQNCECESIETVNVPVRGLSLDLEASAIGGLTEADVQAMIDRSLAANPGGGIMPSLRIGVETLYPALYEGKQVYATLIDFGVLPNAKSKSIELGVADVEWITVSEDFSQVVMNNGSGSYGIGLAANGSNRNWHWSISKTSIAMTTAADRRDRSAIFCILYTKTTDPVIG